MRGWPGVVCSLATRLLLCGWAVSAPAATLNAGSIWNGYFVPGRPVELFVDAAREDGQEVTVTVSDIADPSIRYRHKTDPSSEAPTELRLPVTAVSQPQLTLSMDEADTSVAALDIALEPLPGNRPVVVIVGDAFEGLTLPSVSVLRVSATALPYYAESYGFLDVLVLVGQRLVELNDRQLEALQGFVGHCGRILLHDVPPPYAFLLRASAGCNGHAAVETGPESDPARLLESLVQQHVSASPPAAALAALLDARQAGRLSGAGVFTLLYLASMAVLLLCKAPMPLLLAAPPLAAALTVFTLSGVTPESDWVRWAETDGSNANVPFISVLRVSGNGHGRSTLELPGAPLRIGQGASGTMVEITYDRDRATARLETRLHSQRLLTFRGQTTVPSLALDALEGVPVVRNTGAITSGPALLAWRDAKYQVPELAPASRWRPHADAAIAWNGTAVEHLFRARAQLRVAALLLEERGEATAERTSSRAYVMVTL